ncbi:hypothetical protein A3726_12970 [Erythrobacter sp. HI0037]|nr:hypothetical protein A3719_12160 [Erythrobacter sp. HI0020]KZY15642.1 hypothetical protein A3726_12970 [Erythrobacter sp. HI0037]KZY15739.1 hypothetical protein A3727_08040 [Erythrobacter sp. HI0038]
MQSWHLNATATGSEPEQPGSTVGGDPNTHAQYDITPDLLATNWYTHVVEQTQAPTWDLADTLAADGFHGASYASMHNDLENVALWAWNLNSEAILRVIDQDRRLPKNDKSWR